MTTRLYIYSALLAAAGLLPYAASQFSFDLPLWLSFALLLASEGLRYLAIAFHEGGHALIYWIFGYPAFPLFDTVKGGGVTYSFGRSTALLAGIYVMLVTLAALMFHARRFRLVLFLTGFLIAHAVISAHNGGARIAMFMGHGMEAVAAAWCVIRAFDLRLKTAERFTSLTAATYLYGHVLLLAAALVTSPLRRMGYAVQKGERGSADLDKFSHATGMTVEGAALLLAGFTLLGLGAVVAVLYSRGRRGSIACAS